jgi:hypothetical protein
MLPYLLSVRNVNEDKTCFIGNGIEAGSKKFPGEKTNMDARSSSSSSSSDLILSLIVSSEHERGLLL